MNPQTAEQINSPQLGKAWAKPAPQPTNVPVKCEPMVTMVNANELREHVNQLLTKAETEAERMICNEVLTWIDFQTWGKNETKT